MGFRLHLSRRFSQAGAGIVGAAVAIRVLALPVSPGTRVVDALMAALALCIGLALLRLPTTWERYRQAVSMVGAAALAVAAAIGLRAAAGQLPDFTVYAAVLFTAILVGLDTDAPRNVSARTNESLTRGGWPLAVVAAGAVIAIFVALWLTTAPGSSGFAALVVTVAGMVGIKLLAVGGTERTLAGLDSETRRGHVYATLGRRLGVDRHGGGNRGESETQRLARKYLAG